MKLTQDKLIEILPGDFKLDSRKRNLIGPCPKCKHNEFGISLEQLHRFGCYRSNKCGFTGNIFTLVKFLNIDLNLGELYTNKTSKLENKISTIEELKGVTVKETKLPLGSKPLLKHKYLEDRGFKLYSKYSPHSTNLDPKYIDYIIFPIIQYNTLCGYVSRITIQDKGKLDEINEERLKRGLRKLPRYRNSITNFESILFGYDECKKVDTLIIVEGLFDKERVDFLLELDTQEEIKCVCTFKAHISQTQLSLINRISPSNIIVLYEDDVPIKKRDAVRLLHEQYMYNVTVGVLGDKDPGDMNLEELANIIVNSISSENYLRKAIKKWIRQEI